MIELNDSTLARLRWQQRRERNKKRYVKITTLIMLGSGFTPEQTAKALGVAPATIYRYKEVYKEKGLDDYLADHYVGYSGRLNADEIARLSEELDHHLYINTQEVIEWVEAEFGVTYTSSGMRDLLHRIGFVYKKTRTVPAKADPVRQRQFAEQLTELLQQEDEQQAVFFVDAVHPQHNTRPANGWIRKGHDFPIPANSGRKRVNINGALNANDVTDVTIVSAERINAQSTIALGDKLRQKHPDKQITMVLDNARYYHSKKVKAWLEKHPEVKVLFLPPYSPNLNLIERLWRFLRKEVIDYYYYDTFSKFRQAILDFFKSISTYREELESLLVPKFDIVGFEE